MFVSVITVFVNGVSLLGIAHAFCRLKLGNRRKLGIQVKVTKCIAAESRAAAPLLTPVEHGAATAGKPADGGTGLVLSSVSEMRDNFTTASDGVMVMLGWMNGEINECVTRVTQAEGRNIEGKILNFTR